MTLSTDYPLVMRLHLSLQDGLYKFQTRTPSLADDDETYITPFEIIGTLTRGVDYGQGLPNANIRVKIFDVNDYFRKMFADYERSAIIGSSAILYWYQETGVSPAYSLTLRGTWKAVVDGHQKDKDGNLILTLADVFSELNQKVPDEQITKAEYASVKEESEGEYIPYPYGNIDQQGGALRAWNVAKNKYILSGWDLSTDNVIVREIFYQGTAIDPLKWYVIHEGTPTRTYIIYLPPAENEDSELPADDVEFLSVNLEMDTVNPVTQLKALADTLFGADEFFTGNAALTTVYDNLGVESGICFNDGVKFQSVLTDFCTNWNAYYYIEEGMLKIGQFDAVSQASFTADGSGSTIKCWGVRDKALKELLVNDLQVQYGWNDSEAKYNRQMNYLHQKSISLHNRKVHDILPLTFVQTEATATEMARQFIQKRKYVPVEAYLTCSFNDFHTEGLILGDAVTVNHKRLAYGDIIFNIIGLEYDLNSKSVTLTLLNFVTEADYFVKVGQNTDGGTVTNLGINVVPAGGNFFSDVVPAANMVVSYIFEMISPATVYTIITATNNYEILNIAADYDIVFVFTPSKYLIQSSSAGHGAISPDGDTWVVAGGNQAYDFAPAGAYNFDHFSVDGVSTVTKPYTFTNVQNTHAIIGFANIVYVSTWILTMTYDKDKGKIQPYYPASTTTVPKGNMIWVNFQPNSGYAVTAVTLDGVPKFGNDLKGMSFLMTSDRTLVVTFA